MKKLFLALVLCTTVACTKVVEDERYTVVSTGSSALTLRSTIGEVKYFDFSPLSSPNFLMLLQPGDEIELKASKDWDDTWWEFEHYRLVYRPRPSIYSGAIIDSNGNITIGSSGSITIID